jgi:O-antigen/teichoic acid export membrane protein
MPESPEPSDRGRTGDAARAAAPAPATLRRRVLRAGGWSVAGYALSQAIRLSGNLIMTRLLVPEMFGVMAIATTVSVVLSLMSDIGVRQNIVQSVRGDDPDFLDTAWVIQIIRGFTLWLAALLVGAVLFIASLGEALPAKSVYASPVLPAVIAVHSFLAVIFGFQSTKIATAHRNLDPNRVIQVDLIGQLAGLATMVGVGFATRSIWAIVAGTLVGALTTTLLGHVWLKGHRNRFRWESGARRELLGFGKWVFVSSGVTVLAANGDRLLLGAFVDVEVLGVYAIAVLIIGAIEGAIGRLFSAVSLPALSEVARNDPSRLREIYYRFRVPGDLVLLFVAGLLYETGPLVIDALYDPRYAAAGEMLAILALSLIAARYGIAWQIYLAVGIPRYMAIINMVRCASLFALVPSLYNLGGTHAAIWGIALHGLAMVPFVHAFNARLGLNDWPRELIVLVALPLGLLCGGVPGLS